MATAINPPPASGGTVGDVKERAHDLEVPASCDHCGACFVCHNKPGKDIGGFTLPHTCKHGRKCLRTERRTIDGAS